MKTNQSILILKDSIFTDQRENQEWIKNQAKKLKFGETATVAALQKKGAK